VTFRPNPDHRRIKEEPWPEGTICDANTFEPIFPDDPRHAKYARADGGANIVMIHTDIRGPAMTETDKERADRTGLLSARMADDESKAVQKTPNRVTLDSLLMRIEKEEYLHPSVIEHMTVCILLIDNGFAFVGKAAPADPGNFNEELGRKFAKEDAIKQMWAFEGYLLAEKLSSPVKYVDVDGRGEGRK
jgi:hypothetical protein